MIAGSTLMALADKNDQYVLMGGYFLLGTAGPFLQVLHCMMVFMMFSRVFFVCAIVFVCVCEREDIHDVFFPRVCDCVCVCSCVCISVVIVTVVYVR